MVPTISSHLKYSFLVIILFGATIVSASDIPPAAETYLKHFTKSGLEIDLTERMHMPGFWWPRTLLTYRVVFDGADVPPDDLRLRDAKTGADVPFQLSAVKLNSGELQYAEVNFFSDLPSGGVRQFVLSAEKSSALQKPMVTRTDEAGSIILDTGRVKVRIPASQIIAAGQEAPGPIMQIEQSGNWIGRSTMISPKRAVKAITTETIESGPLFITCRMTYQFQGGGGYQATVRAIGGYEYIEFFEEMQGLPKEEAIYMENAWTNFHPTHRYTTGSPFGGLRKIDEPIVQPFRGEDPAFTGPGRVENPAVEMLPCLTPYWPNGLGGNCEAAFWDEKSDDAIGLFIADVSKWQDHEYALWTSADTLKVKYRYADGVLYWRWPLVTGTRFTGVTCYRHVTGAEENRGPDDETNLPSVTPNAAVKAADKKTLDERDGKELPMFLRIRYGDIGLNRVKDWVLAYPETAKRPNPTAPKGRQQSLAAYMAALPSCAMTRITSGMYHPVMLRDMGYWVVPDYIRYFPQMSPAQREQTEAALLFAAYLSAEEEFSPIQTMLGGHPNFMADLKYPMAAASYLFPEHPLAAEWRDQYEKFLELCGEFYVRPAVPRWEALGGRWTESIATYNWAFLSPTCEGNRLSMLNGSSNGYATPGLAMMGDYLVGILTAPQETGTNIKTWPEGTPLTWENGFKRIHPPQGAHSGKRGPSGVMYTMGEQLVRYRPLTAEHLMWGAFPAAGQGFEDRGGLAPAGGVNRGTNPHLTSAKYAGYGIVLRAGVDTPDEISIYLQQIDKGPNYRWGYANQNGSGDIYYYAKGRSYSGHEREDAGDSHVDDAMFSCNTGVYKNWHFQCIGMNELTEPFYNLDCAQFAEILPASGPGAYSWPEYQSRSVLLAGADYFLIFDRILDPCGTRFSWNISRDDEMPFIYHIKGADDSVSLTQARSGFVRGSLSTMIKGGGSHLALVTHRDDVKIIPQRKKKGEPPSPFVHVRTRDCEDYLFDEEQPVRFAANDMSFEGTSGFIRRRNDGSRELALFHGSTIGDSTISLSVDNSDLGISAVSSTSGDISGRFFSRKGGHLILGTPSNGSFYIDGIAASRAADGRYPLPAGDHRWELTGGAPEPLPPIMLRTENRSGVARVLFTTSPGARKYRIEISRDSGDTWQPAGESATGDFDLTGLTNGTKIHVRAVAMNAGRESHPANEYPVYVTDQPPLPPDGLKLSLSSGRVGISWGEVLGVTEYRLYRRKKGDTAFVRIFSGRQNEFTDRADGVVPAFPEPGAANNLGRDLSGTTIYEYAIAAVNGNGEGAKSVIVDTDPRSWRNWNPEGGTRFKRQTAFWLPPYVFPVDVPPEYYPSCQSPN